MRRGRQELKIAYRVPGPREDLTLAVLYSANAWWMDKEKVYNLLRSFKNMMRLRDACVIAGVTLRQYRYFAYLHPVIERRRKFPYMMASMKAMKCLLDAVYAGDIKASWKWLEMTEPETFSLRRHRTGYGNLRRRYGMKAMKISRTGTVESERELAKRMQKDIEQLKIDLRNASGYAD